MKPKEPETNVIDVTANFERKTKIFQTKIKSQLDIEMAKLNQKIEDVQKTFVTNDVIQQVQRDYSERISTVKQEIRDERSSREVLSDKIKGEVKHSTDYVEKRMALKAKEIEDGNAKLKVWIDELREQMKHRI